MKKTRLSILLLGLSLQGFAQKMPAFTWRAALPVTDSSGYYHIALPAAVSAKAFHPHGWDVRILEGTNEIPYVHYESITGPRRADFRPLPITEQSGSMLTFENKEQRSLNRFEIVYKNSAVRKNLTVTGSNNGADWYGVTEEFTFNPSVGEPFGSDGHSSRQVVQIPASNYIYYRLRIHDTIYAPLFIEQIGLSEYPVVLPRYAAIAGVKLTPVKTKVPKESTWLLDLGGAYPAERLVFQIDAPALYHRQAMVLKNAQKTVVAQFTLSSDAPLVYDINLAKYDSLYLTVRNEDSQPLKISGVEVLQRNNYLVAHLEKGKTYFLQGGAPDAVPPQYDLEHFKSRLNSFALQVLSPTAPETIAIAETPTPSTSFFDSQWWIWAGILLIVGLLGVIVLRIVRDLRDQNTQ